MASTAWCQRPYVETPRLPKEVDAAQVGGIVSGRLIMNIRTSRLGVLRCQAGEAFVALKHKRGSAIDFLQIGCAPVTCNGSTCNWSRANWGASAGNSGGAQVEIVQSCPANSVVSGFKASTNFNGAYAYDFQLECKPMVGRRPEAYINGVTLTPVRPGPLSYSKRYDSTTNREIAMDSHSVTTSCQGNGATAVSYAMGRYGLGIPVVQAFSFYCVNGVEVCPAADPELPRLAAQLKGDMLRLRSAAEVSADHFIFGVSESVIGTLEWLAAPCENGGALGTLGQQLLQFFQLPDDQRNQVLIKAAADAWRLFSTDPARFFGQQAPNAIPVEDVILTAKQAATNLRILNGYADEFGAIAATVKGTRFNPDGSTTNCFLVAIAYDRARATGRMWSAGDGPVVSRLAASEYLRQNFGHRGLQPNHGSAGVYAHRMGLPMPSNQLRIEQALLLATEKDARGLVFVAPQGGGTGHVFNVFKHQGKVYFYDAQGGFYANPPSFQGNVMFYRTN